jgi:hypothetical protein
MGEPGNLLIIVLRLGELMLAAYWTAFAALTVHRRWIPDPLTRYLQKGIGVA